MDNLIMPLRVAATTMHEFYTELVTAGFAEEQALTIVVGLARDASASA